MQHVSFRVEVSCTVVKILVSKGDVSEEVLLKDVNISQF